MNVPFQHVLLVSFLLFAIGMVGVLTRKDAITIFLSVEILLNAANVAFAAFSYAFSDLSGQVIALTVIAVAAAEAAIGLMIVIRLSQHHDSLEVDRIGELKG